MLSLMICDWFLVGIHFTMLFIFVCLLMILSITVRILKCEINLLFSILPGIFIAAESLYLVRFYVEFTDF